MGTIPITDPTLLDRLVKKTDAFTMPYIKALFTKNKLPLDPSMVPWPYKLDPVHRKLLVVLHDTSIVQDRYDQSLQVPIDEETYGTIEGMVVEHFQNAWGVENLTAQEIALDPRITKYHG